MNVIEFPATRVKLCDAGAVYPAAAFQVMVYVPAGFEGEDCEVPEPMMVAGPVIVQEEEMFEETEMVPPSRRVHDVPDKV